jgi:hypothetical protein
LAASIVFVSYQLYSEHFMSLRHNKWITFIVGMLLASVSHAEVDAACKANLKKLKDELTPYINIASKILLDQFQHSAWVNAEMVYALENGCDTRDPDVARDLASYKAGVNDSINGCRSTHDTSRVDLCYPKQHISASGYRRPTYSRAGFATSPRGSAPSVAGVEGRPAYEASSNEKSQVEQSLALVQQIQSRGDEQAKKDKRKRHDAAYEAHQCLTPTDFDNPASFGGMRNNCGFKVSFNFCVYRPKPSSWATAFDCEKQSFGGATAAAGGKGFGHMKGGESVHVFACREPALVLDTRFIAGTGRVEGRCRKIGD